MTQPRTVAVVVGSLRKDSVTRKVVRALEAVAPGHLTFVEVPIGQLPFYNEDDEASPPAAWVEFRNRIAAADAVLFATPEYNRQRSRTPSTWARGPMAIAPGTASRRPS
jgi:chromate reductase